MTPPGDTGRQLVVGVSGHRPNRLARADLPGLRSCIRQVLASISDASGCDVIVLSPLAEGADRLVACEAVARGSELRVVLPFSQQEYARDFPSLASRAEFDDLLARSSDVVDLGGSRTTRQCADRAYAAVGEYTVAQSDVIMVIWDGQAAYGHGGTGDVVSWALDRGRPVIWITSEEPHTISVLARDSSRQLVQLPLDRLSDVLAG